MSMLYNILMHMMGGVMHCAAHFNPKAKLWRDGRKDIFIRMAQVIDNSAEIAWFHAASLGEFEQGRPLIEAYREKYPNHKILLTFFSPSGYEIRKNYKGADYIFYLPNDTRHNVRKFMKTVNPKIAIFIKYEFWVNYLLALKKNGVRTFVVSAIFREDQAFFKWYGGFFRKALRTFEHIFVQNKQSMELLKTIGIENVSITGDTRFDRVAAIAENTIDLPVIQKFVGQSDVFIAGSTWQPDEELLIELAKHYPRTKFIIAPHEIDYQNIDNIISQFPTSAVRYTRIDSMTDLNNKQIMIIDTIGILSSVYKYGTYGYIGGGFGVGIHNTLEAATFGLPLAFGPNYQRFKEACDLIEQGGAVSIKDFSELHSWFNKIHTDKELLESKSSICKEYISKNRGATREIMKIIEQV